MRELILPAGSVQSVRYRNARVKLGESGLNPSKLGIDSLGNFKTGGEAVTYILMSVSSRAQAIIQRFQIYVDNWRLGGPSSEIGYIWQKSPRLVCGSRTNHKKSHLITPSISPIARLSQIAGTDNTQAWVKETTAITHKKFTRKALRRKFVIVQ
ncbi:hypothetical protein PoB_001449700 [Plakobranchus ocellatus]|uniref:Uncharacterized protein n=1 Tax=Plakobranchus ocellatus TaxID=259542 RepID=A0AAV3YYD5_9GAST|nr:hypothetical protein PoB_001449700 [Plakobranchus ocellatus]